MPPLTASDTGAGEKIPIEVFKGPRSKHIEAPDCGSNTASRLTSPACEVLRSGTEGWVRLGFMVDPKGKPFEITVIRSTGNKTLEEVAKKAIEQSTFEPGSLNGKPIESGYELNYVFLNSRGASHEGTTRGFIDAYEALMRAVRAGDRTAADLAMKKLEISDLFEDALVGFATYNYATKWGDNLQQLAGLRRAIAGRSYLPVDVFRSALLACFELEVSAHEYGEALDTWSQLEKTNIDKSTAARLRGIVDHVEKLRFDNTSYALSGEMTDGTWYLHLFKRHFRALVSEGYISQVKLRCDKNYLFFAFDPKLNYEVSGKDGDCSIEFVGAPGTRFELVQF